MFIVYICFKLREINNQIFYDDYDVVIAPIVPVETAVTIVCVEFITCTSITSPCCCPAVVLLAMYTTLLTPAKLVVVPSIVFKPYILLADSVEKVTAWAAAVFITNLALNPGVVGILIIVAPAAAIA